VELISSFKNLETIGRIAPVIWNRIVDRPNRYAMVSHFPKS